MTSDTPCQISPGDLPPPANLPVILSTGWARPIRFFLVCPKARKILLFAPACAIAQAMSLSASRTKGCGLLTAVHCETKKNAPAKYPRRSSESWNLPPLNTPPSLRGAQRRGKRSAAKYRGFANPHPTHPVYKVHKSPPIPHPLQCRSATSPPAQRNVAKPRALRRPDVFS